jgi:hypothetical protein
MRVITPLIAAIVSALALLAAGQARAAITFHQLDDFQSGLQGWGEGSASINPPTWIFSGGPNGANDAFIQNSSSGGGGAGSKQVTFNTAQWAGNYNAAGVTRITMDLKNAGATPLAMRVTLRDFTTVYSSLTAFPVLNDGQWHRAVFDLDAAHLGKAPATGADSLSTVLSNVTEMRLVSAAAGPSFFGDAIQSSVDVDNIFATSIPEPATATLAAGIALLALARRSRRRR